MNVPVVVLVAEVDIVVVLAVAVVCLTAELVAEWHHWTVADRQLKEALLVL